MNQNDVINYIYDMLWNSSTSIKDEMTGSTISVSNFRTPSQTERLTLMRREDQNMTVYSPTKECKELVGVIL